MVAAGRGHFSATRQGGAWFFREGRAGENGSRRRGCAQHLLRATSPGTRPRGRRRCGTTRTYDSARAAASGARRAAHAFLLTSTRAALRARCAVAVRLRLPTCPALRAPVAQGLGREQRAAAAMLRRGAASRATAAAPWCGARYPLRRCPRGTTTCSVTVGLHTLLSFLGPENVPQAWAASRPRFMSAAAKGATRKRSRRHRETQSTAAREVRLTFSDFGTPEARRPQHDTASLQLFAHTGTLAGPPPLSQCADAIIMCETRRTRAPAKHSAPAMKTLEGSGETARASSGRRLAASLRGCAALVSREAAEGS